MPNMSDIVITPDILRKIAEIDTFKGSWNSGGIKIQIEEVEKIVGKHLNNSFAISGKKNIMYGEIVVLYYTPSAHFSQEILTAINN
mgnify:CR=1 FL=1